MGLRVKQLKFIAEDIIRNQRLLETLQGEVRGSVGRLISISDGLDDACYQINNLIDVSTARGQVCELNIKTALLKKLLESKSVEAKKLAVRLLPRNLIINSRFDNNAEVRAEVCRRMPSRLISEVTEAFPFDYEVKYILERKKKEESDSHLHLYDEERIGDASRPQSQPELSDTWYRQVAHKFLEDYGTNIEYQWEEALVRRYCRSIKDTSHVVVDEKKMYETILKLIEEKEDDALLASERKLQKKLERVREANEVVRDELHTLLNGSCSHHVFITKINEKFAIRESQIPAGLGKYISGKSMSIPMKGTSPTKKIDVLAENILDEYVSRWNEVQRLRGEPLKLSWDVDPLAEDRVSFNVILR